ncbi:hypothetical protein OG735_01485 [Streptomyces sp. NBC_01210]|uniref:hypothetical protein n=1 Tax=Streptomyces sp. NBC_01210 TaxID=2903774 RepID=UPI002E1662E8|nr:hypothetical protein OG735_01485 [Streptomyces sp. NBC_01210]
MAYCATREWDKAIEEIGQFLAGAPSSSRIREALNDLKELQGALAIDPSLIQPLRERLDAAADQDT